MQTIIKDYGIYETVTIETLTCTDPELHVNSGRDVDRIYEGIYEYLMRIAKSEDKTILTFTNKLEYIIATLDGVKFTPYMNRPLDNRSFNRIQVELFIKREDWERVFGYMSNFNKKIILQSVDIDENFRVINSRWCVDNSNLYPITQLHYIGKKKSDERKERMIMPNEEKVVDTVALHAKICEELNDLYARKNHDYGDSFHATYLEEGFAMARIRLTDKLNRFKTLSKTKDMNGKVSDESLRDTLRDLVNYGIMTIMEMDRNDGKES